MILNCKKTNEPVAVIMDGVAFITEDFCHSQHFVNVPTIPVCAVGLQERILEIS